MKRSHAILVSLPLAWIAMIILIQLHYFFKITVDRSMIDEAGIDRLPMISSPAPGVPFHRISFCQDAIPMQADTLATIFDDLFLPSIGAEILYPRPHRISGRDTLLYHPAMLTRRHVGDERSGRDPELIGCLSVSLYSLPWDHWQHEWWIRIHILKWRDTIAVSPPAASGLLTAYSEYDSVTSGWSGYYSYRTTRVNPDSSIGFYCKWHEGPWLTEIQMTRVPPKEHEEAKRLFFTLVERISRYYDDLNRRYAKESS